MKATFFLFLFLLSLLCPAQDSCSLRISLLTCSPGEELYSTFGHTAVRVQDRAAGTDLVFNYGTFEFAPDFYWKFIRGKLRYSLSVERFEDFAYAYAFERRSVVEQPIRQGCVQNDTLYAALRRNAEEANRYYRYDFLFDNCTTRARNIIRQYAPQPVVLSNILSTPPLTFRNLIHGYLNRARQDWSKLGIDLLLGAKLDRPATNEEAMFLPENLLKAFEGARAGRGQLVAPVQPLVNPQPLPVTPPVVTPLIFFGLLLALFVAVSLGRGRGMRRLVRVLDFLLFLCSGLVGLLLLFMWFGTDHALCANNYNLLWALPTNLAGAVWVLRRGRAGAAYFRGITLLYALLAVAWFFLPQQMNGAFFPVLLVLLYRGWSHAKQSHHAAAANPR